MRTSALLVPLVLVGLAVMGARTDVIEYTPIDTCDGLSAEDFVSKYASQGRPVVVRGAAAAWPALVRWSYELLRDRFPGKVRNRQPHPGMEVIIHSRLWQKEICSECARNHAEADFCCSSRRGLSRLLWD